MLPTPGERDGSVSAEAETALRYGIVAQLANRNRYRIIDPCVTGLLDLGLCLIEENRGR